MMKYPFRVYQEENAGHIYWVAKSLSLKGCLGQGETADEAINELAENEIDWLETAVEVGIPIPPVPVEAQQEYSGKLTVRIAPSVHSRAAQLAKSEKISLTQYINDAIVNWNAQNTAR